MFGFFRKNEKKNDKKIIGNTNIGYDPTVDADKSLQYKITEVSGFDQLDITLEGDGGIYTRAEAQMIMDKTLSVTATIGGKGIIKGLYRSFSTGTFFINKIKPENSDVSGNVSLFSFIPGKIQDIVLKPGDSWCIHNNAFLACSENITVMTGVSFQTTFTGNGAFYTKITNESGKDGIVWLIAYGGVQKRSIANNNNFYVHSGLFLAMKQSNYEKLQVGLSSTVFSTIAGGLGIVMDFSGVQGGEDDVLYLQTGNLDEFLSFITNQIVPPSSVDSSFFNFISEGGSKKRTTRRKRTK
jgi:uncharacterized protein (TIGR00266 family)